ncbi:hypothetical protein [Chitinophaga deserti]|uniref:hypothetical protein n=1 Tax=Chitinophaga deserti TaxID=2164099 RepID=UPI000D6C1EEF|nr:hypothetical protein [Chitinophaga deserti]
MQPNTSTTNQDDHPIYTTISRFLSELHHQEGRNIRHVTVTVHGTESHFRPCRQVHRLEVTRMKGHTALAYQEMTLDAPVENTVMLVALEPGASQ